MPAERVGALLHCPWHAVRTRQPIEVTIGILSRMKTVVGIRLHSLMFSAGQGVPVVGMSYYIKVDGFLNISAAAPACSFRPSRRSRCAASLTSASPVRSITRCTALRKCCEKESPRMWKGAAKLLNIS